MKKNILLLMIFTLSLMSCEKYLEVEPTNVVTLTTYDDVKALMGSYIYSFTSGYKLSVDGTVVPVPYNTYGNHLFFALYGNELDTDYFLNNAFARNHATFYKESLNWMNMTFPGTIWNDYFLGIGFLNTIIDALEDVEGGTPEQKDIVKNEAKVLRAWYLFKLQQYFSPYKQSNLGIPFNFDSKNIGSYDRGRKRPAEVYNTIVTELTEVIECSTPPRETYNIWYDKKIAHAILAQLYHFKGESAIGEKSDYEHAITHAKAAMEGRSLMSIEDYRPFTTLAPNTFGVFKDMPQALLTTVVYSTYGMYADMNVPPKTSGLYPQFAREEVYDLYDDNDVRKALFFVLSPNKILGGGKMSPAVKKYQAVTFTTSGVPEGGSRSLLIFNFFPIADLHLIVAESYARLNDTPNAILWLEQFQKERYKGYTTFGGSDVLAEILLERRREFFMESDYCWCDLIRQNEEWERNSDGSDPNVEKYKIEKDDFRYCLPISITQEMAYNKIEQNPGWGM